MNHMIILPSESTSDTGLASRDVFSNSFSVFENSLLPTTIFHSLHNQVSPCLIFKKTAEEHMPHAHLITTPGHEYAYNDYDFYGTQVEQTLVALGLSKNRL